MPIPNSVEDGALELLDRRRSTPARQLGEPAPDHPTLLRILRSAVRVPDHGKRVPFRFLRIEGDARQALGEAVAAIGLRLRPGAAQAAIDKDRQRFAHAPLVLAVVAVLDPEDTIPETERLMTAGCVCFAVLQAAQALGYGGTWLTGWPAFDPDVMAVLGLGPDERIAGFIHLGTPRIEVPERERPDPAALLRDWTPA
ncbi:nitroreductase [Luteimonas sp. YGD11-2]|uniref:nitroreductase family protein n=1 Tax=Luteimonas sp. YGD11-2 TaxID=2508168 RepID=UPI00100BFFD7|nr:nitroreductase [Luteimonas sp. YGD11-2]